jgi:RHS repeat-associated protein
MTSAGKVTTYTYDAADRLLSAGDTTFTYDAKGNRLSQSSGREEGDDDDDDNDEEDEEGITYEYDAANRLIRVLQEDKIITYEYDGDGNKVGQTIRESDEEDEEEVFRFLNDVASTLPVVLTESRSEEDDEEDVRYIYGLGLIAESGSEVEDEEEKEDEQFKFFYHFDGLGSVVDLTQDSGASSAHFAYDAWGEPTEGENALAGRNRFRFTGEELDADTGLYYLRARWYDPSVGRFINRDPSSGIITNPLSQNRYSYVTNNPANRVDPVGLFGIERDMVSQNTLGAARNQLASIGMSPGVKVAVGYFRSFVLKALEIADKIPKGASNLIESFFAGKKILKATEVIPPKIKEVDDIYRSRSDLRDRIDASISSGKSWDQLTPEEKNAALLDVTTALGGLAPSGFLFPRVPEVLR